MVFFQFLIVFFANHVLPGIYVVNQTKLPHVGGDLLFAFVLGVINALICPFLNLMKKSTAFKLFLSSVLINFAAYGLLKIVPIGIQITSLMGYLLTAGLVALGSFLINCFELHSYKEDSSSYGGSN